MVTLPSGIVILLGRLLVRHAENWNFICYPPIYHPWNSEYGRWGKFLQKEKNQINPLLFLIHLIFLVFFIFAFSMQIQNSLHLKPDLHAFKCKEIWK